MVKNKVAPPFRVAEFDILYGEGISREGETARPRRRAPADQKSGTWLSYGEERLGQGRENARMFLKEHPELLAEIEGKLRPLLPTLVRAAGGGDEA